MLKEESVIIDAMQEDDLDEVVKIEGASFPDPWTYNMFKAEMSNSFSRLWVARDASGVAIGYICFWLIEKEVHILDLAVHPLHRRKGVGSRLLSASLNYWERAYVRSVYLEVRESNEAAQRLYERFGFKMRTRRPQYYKNPKEDAYIMWLELT